MNATKLASECRRLANELSNEALRWTEKERRDDLFANALQLGYLARSVQRQPAGVVQAVIEAATTVLVVAMTQRAFGESEGVRG